MHSASLDSGQTARLATDRIWSCVMRQWDGLGGVSSLRRADAALAAAASPKAPVGHTAEAIDSVALLLGVLRDQGVSDVAVQDLTALIAGRLEPERSPVAAPASPTMRAA